MKRLVVTGGAGFIGSHVVEALLEAGFEVLVIDNFNDFYAPKIKERNLARIREKAGDKLKVVKLDICDKAALLKEIEAFADPDTFVLHLAARAGVRPSILHPELYSRVNIDGTINILEVCKILKLKKLVFASSSSVDGDNKNLPFRESDQTTNPISPYAATKKAGELLCYTYHKLYSLQVLALRFFTVYGPRQRPDLAISKFTELILKNEEIPVFGDGSSERDYTYIDDIVDGVLKSVAYLEAAGEKSIYEIVNLGESKTVSLSTMIETLEKHLGKKAIINRLPSAPGDLELTYADISYGKELIGYNPTVDFDEGIKRFVAWRKNLV